MPVLIPLVLSWLTGLTIAALGSASGTHAFDASIIMVVAIVVSVAIVALAVASLAAPQRLGWWVRPSALAAVLIAGLLVGQSHAAAAHACRQALAMQPSLAVAIDERIGPGVRVTGEARYDATQNDRTPAHPWLARCAVRVSLRAASGEAPAGAIVRAAGTPRATETGLRLDGPVTPTGRSDILRAWRGRTGETIDALFGENAALVRALLIADQDGISPAVRDRFADAGLVHMLSISGLHVAIIAGSLLTLATALRLSRDAATASAILLIGLYVLMLGAPAPAVRSAVMLVTLSIGERLQRPVHPWTALALGAAIPTVDPAVVLDLGYQLSVSGMASLVAARALIRRFRATDPAVATRTRQRVGRSPWHRTARAVARLRRYLLGIRGWQWTLVREAMTGVVATLVTAPLVAWTFGRVSLIAPLSNLAAGPVVAFVQPALFLAVVLSPWHSAAQWVADATIAPLALLDRIAALSAAVPHAALRVAPTLFGACCAGIASAAFVRATAARRIWPGVIAACGALVLAAWAPVFNAGSGLLELHMIDVGQGDALGLRTPNGRWVVVDAGRAWDGGDAGRRVVVPYIQRRGGRVAAFVMSHAHDDHVGGAASVLDALAPRQWWEPAFVATSSAYRSALVSVRRGGVRWARARPHDHFVVDGVTFTVMAPDSAWTIAQPDANETSVVLRVQYGTVRMLLTGDAEAGEERWILDHYPADELAADVLKVGHHGSRTSSSPEFLDAVRPRLALLSVGADNKYGHPSPETLLELARRSVPWLRTDRDGSVVVRTDGTTLWAESGGQRWTVPPRT